jgi:hypothetical protein
VAFNILFAKSLKNILICDNFEILVFDFSFCSAFSEFSKVKPFKFDTVGKKKGADLGTFGGSFGLLRSYNKT